MEGKLAQNTISLLDTVVLTEDLPQHNLWRGEIGAVVECHNNDAYEIEFVAQDGYTYALITLSGSQLIPLRQKQARSSTTAVPVAI